MSLVHPVLLSGGLGSRLWPHSRRQYPKQLHPLCSASSMIAETAARMAGNGFSAPLVVCNQEHRFLIAAELQNAGSADATILVEPEGRNTAPAALAAALQLADRDAVMLVTPSDHFIGDVQRFHEAVRLAGEAAEQGYLVTLGAKALRPDTGFGYIRRGEEIADIGGVYAVGRFVEKPDEPEAAELVANGGYFWNVGVFVFRAASLIEEAERLEPEMLKAVRDAVSRARRDLDFVRLDEASFARCPNISIDHAVMERTARAAVVPVDMGWSDVGSWRSLWEISDKDSDGNASRGDAILLDARNSYVHSSGGMLTAVIGVGDLAVVTMEDAVLVVPLSEAHRVREVVEALGQRNRSEHLVASTVHRPWGHYHTIDSGERFIVKQIVVKPGAALSLQRHYHRAEHWVVVRGTAQVVRGEKDFLLNENESIYIPAGEVHRLANPGKIPLQLIEVQSGSYLSEDDIVRLDDVYGRESEG